MPSRTVVVALTALAVAGAALASGFSIYEQSARASGLAGAWVAQADDAAANWYNPAALIWLDDDEFQVGTNLIFVGADTQLTSADRRFGLARQTTFETEGSVETPSHLYFRRHCGERFSWGVGINTPYGLVSEWTERPVTFSARKSELKTFVVNPNFAFRVGDDWAIGIGLDYMLADIGEFSRDVPIDLDRNPLNGFEIIGSSNLSGDGSDLGFNLAVARRAGGTSFAFTYRSALDPKIEGEIEFERFGPLAPLFRSGPGSAVLELPEQAVVAFSWTAGDWVFESDVAYAGWSAFDTLVIDIENNVPGFVEDVALSEDWDDTFSFRFGAAWKNGDVTTWRFGGVYDQSPVQEETLRPAIPDSSRLGLTLGYGYSGDRWNVDAYAMALFFRDITARSGEDGVIAGTYESFGTLLGFTVSRRF